MKRSSAKIPLYVLCALLAVAISLSIIRVIFAVDPNPGHTWAEIDDTPLTVAQGGTSVATLGSTEILVGAGTSAITSTTTVAANRGGTGAATLTANNVILGNGTSPVTFVAPGTSGNMLKSDGTTWTSASVKIVFSGATPSLTADSNCNADGGNCANNDVGHTRIPVAMTISNLYARMTTAPASSNSCAFTVQVASDPCTSFSNTSLTCTITGNGSLRDCSDIDTASISAGQCIRVFFDETGTCTGVDNWTFYGTY